MQNITLPRIYTQDQSEYIQASATYDLHSGNWIPLFTVHRNVDNSYEIPSVVCVTVDPQAQNVAPGQFKTIFGVQMFLMNMISEYVGSSWRGSLPGIYEY